MHRCIELALHGLGKVAPNPLVGAVLVHNEKIIGEGFHQKFGEAHAEVNAINEALKNGFTDLLSDATLYVNLEPCSHYGKTPPCTDLILKHKIPRVVIGSLDPFHSVNGAGVSMFEKAGVVVTKNVLHDECVQLNNRFFTFQLLKRPYVLLKFAKTLNGLISSANPSDSKRISSPSSDILIHKWRSEETAIMVGTRTALLDNPRLNLRYWIGTDPVRVLLDRNLKIPHGFHLMDDSVRTLVFNSRKDEVVEKTEFIKIDFSSRISAQVLDSLHKAGIQSVLIEGGAVLLNEFISSDLWDEARIFTGKKIFNSGVKSPEINGELSAQSNESGDHIEILFNTKITDEK